MERFGLPTSSLSSAAGPEALELGATLREMRMALKRELDDVAAELRIRSAYLLAIEEGRYDDLPGVTYALGFVRAYADYVGADSDDAVRQFKAALGGDTGQPPLLLPAPVAEGRLPTGAVLLVAACLAIAAYGGWYYLSTQGEDAGSVFASLGDRIGEMIQSVRTSIAPTPDEMRQASSARPAPAERAAKAEAPAAAFDTAAGAPGSALPAQTAATGENEVASVAADDSQAAEEDEDTAPPPPEEVAEAPAAPAAGGSPRIVLVARADSWVELRDGDGAQLVSRLLRTGESYEVPNKPGLTMMTGNAGGLRVLVDGKVVAPLGAPGAVRRGIALDPERLLAGMAIPSPP